MHMFRRIFQHPIATIMILHAVNGKRLESPPTDRKYQRISCFQNSWIPSMFHQAGLNRFFSTQFCAVVLGDQFNTRISSIFNENQ